MLFSYLAVCLTNISTQKLYALFVSLINIKKTLAGLVIAILVPPTAACTKKQVGQFGILLASTLCYNLFGLYNGNTQTMPISTTFQVSRGFVYKAVGVQDKAEENRGKLLGYILDESI